MSGYIFYVEWVRSGSLENQKKFEQMLGMKFESDTYIDLADSLGMTAQDESLFDGIGKKQLKNVDISIDDIVTLSLSGGSMLSGEAIPVDMSAELAKIPLRWEGTLFAYMMRSLMNLTLKYTSSLDISSLGMDPRLFDTIVEKRNKYVVDSYIASGHQKVVFLYGALHFQGMYDLLRRSNPDWNILTLEPLYPYVP